MEAQKKPESSELELVGEVEKTLTVVSGMHAEAEAKEASRKDAKIISGLKKRAVDALTAAEKALNKYWELLVYIRDNQIPPPVVSQQLKEAGYQDSRVAEVKRVAFCSPQLFDQYRNRAIGFRLALGKAREEAGAGKAAPKPLAESAQFRNELMRLCEGYVPAAGKVPKWLRSVKLEVQGCEIVFTVKRWSGPAASEEAT